MKVSNDVLAVLTQAEVDGNALKLVGNLDRGLYERTNKVLEAAGGKWSRKAKAHLFDGPADEAIDQIVLSGEITIPQDFGFFPTPADIVERVLELADIKPGMSVLEPSAGHGAIAAEVAKRGAVVDMCELLPANVEKLRSLSLNGILREADFLTIPPTQTYDAICMNPPFAKQADIKHVMHAHQFLKPGGRLVSVMAAGVIFRSDRLTTAFKEFVEQQGGSIEELPEGAFKSSGTMVKTVIATIPA
jgi:protein-L-isoaspartate O-methyltransferase